jgi:hypothetical protein
MPRMIDPSELEGDELATWYGRSPAEVEAEREGLRQQQYDAFVKSIGAPSEPLDDMDGEPHVIQARFPLPTGAPVMAPPSGPRVGPTLDTWGAAPIGTAKSGFFGVHDYSPTLGGYYTDLPSPLNAVRSNGTRWWELGDGSLVQTDEVERIYAEQQRRLKGQDGAEPVARVRVIDRWKDGQIPRADQVEKGERELDPTCAPNGGWERDPGFGSYSGRTQRYETQVTRAPGLDYVVRNPGQGPVKFDGCAVWDPRHSLLEAKGPGYAALLPKSVEWGFFGNILKGAVDQADRQAAAAPNQRIEWHVAEPGAFEFFDDATWAERPPIHLLQTPVR